MTYVKVTLDAFKKKLKGGVYANATAAKRALGRVQEMTEEEKSAARSATEKFFGVAKAKKVVAAPAKTAPVAAPAKAASPKAAAPKAVPAPPAAPAKKRGRPKKVVAAPTSSVAEA